LPSNYRKRRDLLEIRTEVTPQSRENAPVASTHSPKSIC
jgi:hypothetical protein